MQLPIFSNFYNFAKIQSRLKFVWSKILNFRYWFLVLFLILLSFTLLIQPTKSWWMSLGKEARKLWYVADENSNNNNPPTTSTKPPEINSIVAILQESNQGLEQRVGELEKVNLTNQEMLKNSQDQLKSALAEVAKINDTLSLQESTWSEALKKVGITIKNDGSLDENAINSSSVKSSQEANTDKKININTASLAELDTLPGIGPSFAQKIINYREEKGTFKTLEDLERVSGIGPATFAKLKDMIEV